LLASDNVDFINMQNHHHYFSLVRPHLEYACDEWDSHLATKTNITLIENVQKFGLRICAKQWDLGYDELMSNFDICTLQTCHLEYKLCMQS